MRILHLISSGGVYGAERILLYLAREQQRRGHEPIIGSIAKPGTGVALEEAARAWGLAVAPVRIGRLPTPPVVRGLIGQIRDLAADVVHSHGYKSNILLGPVSRRRRPPILATLHGWTAAKRLSAMSVYERLDQWALRSIDSVVVVSANMLQLPGLRRVPRARLRVIENGIPDLPTRLADLGAANARPLPEALLAAVRARPTLVAIGRLSPEKGFDLLVEAFGQARAERKTPHQLIIVGEGPDKGALASRIADLGLRDHVLLPGYLEGPDRLLNDASGFVMSSFTEGMPLVLLEALQWGAPVVATRVGAIPEILEHSRAGAVMVPPHDLPALRQALGQLMAAPGKRQAIQREADGKRYSSGRMAEEYLSAYQAIT